MVTGTHRHLASAALVALLFSVAVALAGCGDNGARIRGTDSVSDSSPPATTSPSGPASSPGSTGQPTTESATESSAAIVPTLAAGSDGLGVASFGDEAEGVIQALIGVLGAPDVDTGWQDPTDPSNQPLWPGCPGTTARLLQWTGNLGVLFTDWDGDLSTPGGTLPERYFAGYGLWQSTSVRTVDGASPGMTLADARAIYGVRISISDLPDDAVGLYSFAVDGTGSPLTRTGPLRGWLFPPAVEDGQQGPDDDWTIGALTAGVSCDTP